MYRIAVDLGYGYIKGINQEGKKICFPSLVGPARSLKMRGFLNNGEDLQYQLFLKHSTLDKEYFVGHLAEEESPTASYAFDENKINHPHTRVLLAAAAALLSEGGNSEPLHLATGLPLQHFFNQRNEFLTFLNDFEAEVSVGGGTHKRIVFDKVTLFPQGAGAIMEAGLQERDLLQQGSYLGLVDFGFRTTDYVVYEAGDKFKPKSSLSGTIEIGMADLYKAVEAAFADLAGVKLDVLDIDTVIRNGSIFYAGKDYDLKEVIAGAKADIAGAVLDRLKEAWGQKTNFLRVLFLAGGGAVELKERFKGFHGDVRLLRDPQFGNARGFLRVITPRGVENNVVSLHKNL